MAGITEQIKIALGWDLGAFQSGLSEITGGLKGATKGTDDAAKATVDWQSGLRVAAGVVTAVGTAVTATMLSGVQGARELAAQQKFSNALWGEGSKALQEWAKQGPQAFGLTTAEVLKTVNTMGSLLTSQGMAQDSALSMSKEYVRVGTALDSAFSLDRGYTVEAITSALQGNYQMLRNVGITTNATDVAQRALQETGKTSTAQLTQQEKAQALYNLVLERSSAAVEAYGDGTQSLGTQMATFQKTLEEARTEMGAALLPVLLQLFQAINPLVGVVLRVAQAFSEYRAVTVPLVLGITALAAAIWIANAAVAAYNVVQGIAIGIAAARTGAEVVGNAAIIAKTVATVAMTAASGAAAVATGVMTVAQWALNVALTANPIGIVVVALAALVAALIIAWNSSSTFRNIVTGAFNAVVGAIQAVVSAIGNAIAWIGNLVSTAARVTGVGAIFQTAFGAVAAAVSAIIGPIQAAINVIGNLIGKIGELLSKAAGAVGAVAGIGAASAPATAAYATYATPAGEPGPMARAGLVPQAEAMLSRLDAALGGGQRGPALVIQGAVFQESVDVTLLLRKTQFAVEAGRL
jgi:hypothetical protein